MFGSIYKKQELMMYWFHCPHQLVSRTIDFENAIANEDVVVGIKKNGWLVCTIRNKELQIELYPDQYYANLSVDLVTEPSRKPQQLTAASDGSLLALSENFAKLEIKHVMPTIDNELAFVEAKFSMPRLLHLVAKAREHHEKVKKLIKAQAFEDATPYKKQRDKIRAEISSICIKGR